MIGLIFGIILLLLAVFFVIGEIMDSVACSKQTTARLVRMEKDPNSYWKGSYRYYPVFAYAVDGREYVSEDKASPTRSTRKYVVGQERTIRYSPKNPEQFRTGAKASVYAISLVLAAAGAGFITLYFL